jgi:serine phosphatase RsbU (regulator of sigma subunit)
VAHGQLALTEQGAAVRLANAGHPPPLALGQGPAAPMPVLGTLLGVNPHVALTEVAFELRGAEMLVLYTDGVTEARGVDGFSGAQRLMKTVGFRTRSQSHEGSEPPLRGSPTSSLSHEVTRFSAPTAHDEA